MNKQNARAKLTLFGDLSDEQRQTCTHGHPQCAVSAGGDCFDDLIQDGIVQVDEPKANSDDNMGDC